MGVTVGVTVSTALSARARPFKQRSLVFEKDSHSAVSDGTGFCFDHDDVTISGLAAFAHARCSCTSTLGREGTWTGFDTFT